MRVLHTHSGNMYGGVETLLSTLTRYRDLCPAMESHYALCFEGRLSDELTTATAPVHLLGNVRVRQPLTVLRARRGLGDLLRHGLVAISLRPCHSCAPAAGPLAALSYEWEALAGSLGQQSCARPGALQQPVHRHRVAKHIPACA